MFKQSILAASVAAAIAATPAHAGKVEELEAMMIRMQAQMEQLQGELAEAKTRAADAQAKAESAASSSGARGGFGPNVTLSGSIDIQGNYMDPYATAPNSDTSDLTVAEALLNLDAQVNDWISGAMVLKYEEGANGDNLNVDEVFVVLGNDESPATLQIGKTTAFGAYETHMITDPLTLTMAETSMTLARVDVSHDGFGAGVWLYNGDTSKASENADELNHFGLSLGYGQDLPDGSFAVGIDWASDISDSGGLSGAMTAGTSTAMADNVSGMSMYGSFNHGPWSVMGEYTAASDRFAAGELAFRGQGAKPEAWNLEVGRAVTLGSYPGTVALGFGGSDEAQAVGLAENRIIAALALDIADNTSLGFEWNHEEDYNVADGGTGNDQDTYTVQVVVSF